MAKEYPASNYQPLVGKTIKSIQDAPNSDEGLLITFTDGSVLDFGFSGCEGSILGWVEEENANEVQRAKTDRGRGEAGAL